MLREARLKVSPAFSKAAGYRGGALARAPQSAELSCALISAGGGLRGNPRRGFPLFFWACACAPIRWEVVVTLPCLSTPFLWCLPKETVSSRQRKALFYLGGSTIRVSATASVDYTFLARLGEGLVRLFSARSANESFVHLFKGGRVQGRSAEPPLCLFKRRRGSKGEPSPGVSPFLLVSACAPLRWAVFVTLSCHSTPFLWCLPKETMSSRQRKALFYPGGSTIRVSATSRWTIRSSPDLGKGGAYWCLCASPLFALEVPPPGMLSRQS